LIFNFATDYYYNNTLNNLNTYKFPETEFNKFKNYLKSSGFDFETETEKAFNKAMVVAEGEELDGVVDSEFHNISAAIQAYKSNAIDANKTQLKSLLTDEIIKRYFYSEGLYTYYKANNPEIKKALSILNNPTQYASILR